MASAETHAAWLRQLLCTPAPWKLSVIEASPEVADTPITAAGVPLRAGSWTGLALLPI